MEHLGKEITRRRVEQKLSLRQVGAMTGLSHQAIHNAEHGQASFEAALLIAKRLGVPQEKLVALAEADARDLAEGA